MVNYYLARGLAEFHVGQLTACAYGDQDTALEYFKAALTSSEKVGYPEDVAYNKATVAFLEGDIDTLQAVVDQNVCSAKNQQVVTRLYEALQNGNTDYASAYGWQ